MNFLLPVDCGSSHGTCPSDNCYSQNRENATAMQIAEPLAELMQQEKWTDAAAAWAGKGEDELAPLYERFCRNMSAMQKHRPGIYRTLFNAGQSERYQLVPSRSGALTISAKLDGGKEIRLSADNDPHAAVETIIRAIAADCQSGKPLALASIGDGYLLSHLSANAPSLILGREQAVILCEPDPSLVLACLMIHDYTGSAGPIEQTRIRWYIGADWAITARQDFLSDLMLLHPAVTLRIGLDSKRIDEQLKAILLEMTEVDRRLSQQIESFRPLLSRQRLIEQYSENPARPPKALIITTRFSTVLQYSARDTEQAFRQNGWDTRLLIEPSASHGMSRLAIKYAIADFKPELIFLIDHLRSEFGDLYPPEIPLVCWVQDHLPNLTNKNAGASVGFREFALIPSAQRYVKNYGYPESQCMEFRKLTKVPSIPDDWNSDGDDLVYVSNWSQTPEQLTEEAVAILKTIAPEHIARNCCEKICKVYEQGGSLQSPGEVRRLLGLVINGEQAITFLTHLHERLNVGLFRQQGLSWAAEVAEELGLKLSIYGNGWDKNPRFAKYARGSVKYGPDLENLTRKSKINLLLEPYVCIAHQRLLDGVAAGGFFLMRSCQQSQVLDEMISILADETFDHAFDSFGVLGRANPQTKARIEELLKITANNDAQPEQIDPIRTIRELQASGFLPKDTPLLPQRVNVEFDSRQMLRSRILQTLQKPEDRTAIIREQREAVLSRYSYSAGIKRLIAWMQSRFSLETNSFMKQAG